MCHVACGSSTRNFTRANIFLGPAVPVSPWALETWSNRPSCTQQVDLVTGRHKGHKGTFQAQRTGWAELPSIFNGSTGRKDKTVAVQNMSVSQSVIHDSTRCRQKAKLTKARCWSFHINSWNLDMKTTWSNQGIPGSKQNTAGPNILSLLAVLWLFWESQQQLTAQLASWHH